MKNARRQHPRLATCLASTNGLRCGRMMIPAEQHPLGHTSDEGEDKWVRIASVGPSAPAAFVATAAPMRSPTHQLP